MTTKATRSSSEDLYTFTCIMPHNFISLEMKNPIEIEVKESLAELIKLQKKQPTLAKEKRVKALIDLVKNPTVLRGELSQRLGVDRKTLRRWLLEYKKGGINCMLEIRPKHKGSKIITPQIHAALEARVNNPRDSFKGYWDAMHWIKTEFDVDVKYHLVRKYLIKHFKTSVKRPRKSHTNKSEAAVAVFKKLT